MAGLMPGNKRPIYFSTIFSSIFFRIRKLSDVNFVSTFKNDVSRYKPALFIFKAGFVSADVRHMAENKRENINKPEDTGEQQCSDETVATKPVIETFYSLIACTILRHGPMCVSEIYKALAATGESKANVSFCF